MKPHRIASETALKMTPTEMLDVIFDAPEYSIIELSVINPDTGTGNNRGIYLEILTLDDFKNYCHTEKGHARVIPDGQAWRLEVEVFPENNIVGVA